MENNLLSRRQFIKVLALPAPLLITNPLLFLRRLHAGQGPVLYPDFLIVTLGRFGQHVQDAFGRLHKDNPILQPCMHSHPQVNTDQGFVHIDLKSPSLPAAPPEPEPSVVCLVFDPDEPGALVWAEALAESISGPWQSCIIALFPAGLHRPQNRVFTFYWQVEGATATVASVLHTLYSCWYGCGGIGNLMCLKVHLACLQEEKATAAAVFANQAPMTLNRLEPFVKVTLAGCKENLFGRDRRGLFFIWQAPKSLSLDDVMDGFDQIVTCLETYDEGSEISGLPHPSIATMDQKLVLFRITD